MKTYDGAWKRLVPHCIDSKTLKFAGDVEHYLAAMRMFRGAKNSGVDDEEILRVVKGYIQIVGKERAVKRPEQIEEEVAYVKALLRNIK